jgi:hypothetical protein
MKRIITILGLVGLLAGSARADPTLTLEALREHPNNQNLVRTTAIAQLPGKLNGFAFADFYGRSSDAFYSEASLGRQVYAGFGPKIEWNGGSGMDDLFRAGLEYIPDLGDGIFLDSKAYPLTIGSNGRVILTSQISLFGRIDIPWNNSYLENWTDINLSLERDSARRVDVSSEATIGTRLTGSLSAELQGLYNVTIPHEIEGRAGLRYDF